VQALQKDISKHHEELSELQKLAAASLESRVGRSKQDVVLIRNLVSSVNKRFERLNQRALERTRQLELGYREAKAFADAKSSLLEWIDGAVSVLDDPAHRAVTSDPEKIQEQIRRHKEFHRSLGNKQSGLCDQPLLFSFRDC
jgi:hypothetical protein